MKIIVYTDASIKNGHKRYAYIILDGEGIIEQHGIIRDDLVEKSCHAELTAIIKALRAVKKLYNAEHEVLIKSDARDVINIAKYKLSEWANTEWNLPQSQKQIAHLWKELYNLTTSRKTSFQWIKRRSDRFAKRCDKLTRIRTQKKNKGFIIRRIYE